MLMPDGTHLLWLDQKFMLGMNRFYRLIGAEHRVADVFRVSVERQL